MPPLPQYVFPPKFEPKKEGEECNKDDDQCPKDKNLVCKPHENTYTCQLSENPYGTQQPRKLFEGEKCNNDLECGENLSCKSKGIFRGKTCQRKKEENPYGVPVNAQVRPEGNEGYVTVNGGSRKKKKNRKSKRGKKRKTGKGSRKKRK